MLTTSVEAICFNYRPKKDNTYPIMLRLTKSGKRKYVSLEVSVKEEDWDFSKNTPKRKCPDRDLILSIIEKRTAAYTGVLQSHTASESPIIHIGQSERHNFHDPANQRNLERDKEEIPLESEEFQLSLTPQDLWQTGLQHEQ